MNRRFHTIDTIKNDAPFSNITHFTISFLTTEKMDENFKLKAFKVYSGYTSNTTANNDAEEIKRDDNRHDIAVGEIGKVHKWDDVLNAENINYDNAELDKLDKTRREHADKAKMIQEQINNEHTQKVEKKYGNNSPMGRKNEKLSDLRKKAHAKGIITKEEYQAMEMHNKTRLQSQESAEKIKKILTAADNCTEDYLTLYKKSGFRYGCITMYLPDNIVNLKDVLFKVRGLFETEQELNDRVAKLKQLDKEHPIGIFEIGKWTVCECVYPEKAVKLLNYGMKCFYEHAEQQNIDFKNRVDSELEKASKQSAIHNDRETNKTRTQMRREQKKKNRHIDKINNHINTTVDNKTTPTPTHPVIDSLADFLEDPELKNKFLNEKKELVTEEINI
jgi:hypothetical protein